MTLAEVESYVIGFERRKAKDMEIQRLLTTFVINSFSSEKMKPEDVYPLIIDKERYKERLMTKEEYKKTQDIFKRAKWRGTNLKHG